MGSPTDLVFSSRPTVTLELPLPPHVRIVHPEQVVLKIGSSYHDVGAYCYALRSNSPRFRGQPRDVAISSFLKHRPKRVLHIIEYLNRCRAESGWALPSVSTSANYLKQFLDWADTNGVHNCLTGGDPTKRAFELFATALRERYRQHELGAKTHNRALDGIRALLEVITHAELARVGRKVVDRATATDGTEPAQPHDFAHALALNQALFNSLCDLVLNDKPFPFQLDLPKSLGWDDSFLWVFPLRVWRQPPHVRKTWCDQPPTTFLAYDYEHGRLATINELAPRFSSKRFPKTEAGWTISLAQRVLDAANHDLKHWARVMLAMHAHNAFMFLFFSNTGCNESVAREIETDGQLDISTLNQSFRSIKFRAQGKQISLETPVTFLPALRKFMELRHWLLNGTSYPYLFFTLGPHNQDAAARIAGGAIDKTYKVLQSIDPGLPRWGSRKIRATVADYYQRNHDTSVTAKILQNSPETALRKYNAGSAVEHHTEMSLFLEKVAAMSAKQQIHAAGTNLGNARTLEEGGCCSGFGSPAPMADGLPVEPDCKQGQGCLFCEHRILIAGEEDARKVASAAFVMEQVILGPLHEAVLRPLICKCDDDLEKIAAFPDCRKIVDQVRVDVFESGNLTPFFADKFHLFLELGVIT